MYWTFLLSMVALVSTLENPRPVQTRKSYNPFRKVSEMQQPQTHALPIKSYAPFKTVRQQQQQLQLEQEPTRSWSTQVGTLDPAMSAVTKPAASVTPDQQLRYSTHATSHSPPDKATVQNIVVATGQRPERDKLKRASAKGDGVEAKRLLDLGADVNARDQWQRTPLHLAKNETIAKLLLDHGADVHARDIEQQTPLHRARNAAMVKLLLDHGAEASVRDIAQRSPLHVAKNEAMVNLLLDHGAPRFHAGILLVVQRVKGMVRWFRASALWRKCRRAASAVAARIREPIPSEMLFRMLTFGIDQYDGSEAQADTESSNPPKAKGKQHGEGFGARSWLGAIEDRVVAKDPAFAQRLNEARLARFLHST